MDAKSIENLAAQFFDQERFLKQALKRVTEAKDRGESVLLQELMTDEQSVKPKKPRKPRSPKSNAIENVLDDSVTTSTSDIS